MTRYKILEYLKENNDSYISGELIAASLGLSRNAVNKAIKTLRNQGFVIESSTRLGYRLLHSPDIITKQEIESRLRTKKLGRTIEIFDEIDSTNTYIKKNYRQKPDGLTVLADCQTGGRGRFERRWFSQKGRGLYFSILIKPDINISDIGIITLSVGLAVVKALEDICEIKPSIKWPNDIVIENKKLGGILTEATVEAESGRVGYIVIGIGINCHQKEFDNEIKNKAVSLINITGRQYSRSFIAAEILNRLEPLLTRPESKDSKSIINEYNRYLCLTGKKISCVKDSTVIEGICKGVNNSGHLLLDDRGRIHTIHSGEISLEDCY